MQLLGNLKIHFLALVLTVVAEYVGIKKLGPVVLLPLLYTLILACGAVRAEWVSSTLRRVVVCRCLCGRLAPPSRRCVAKE